MSQTIRIPKPKLLPISLLKQQTKNVKLHPMKQVQGLAKLIELVGFKDPVVIDRKNVVWAGHGRLEAAHFLKMKRVPCIYLEGLNEEQKKAFMLMDNKIAESEWNQPNLKLILNELPNFKFEEFHMQFDDFTAKIDFSTDDPLYEKPLPVEVPPRSAQGDTWELGTHRVRVGDCTVPSTVVEFLKGKTVDQVVTDPPYGVDYAEKNKFLDQISPSKRITRTIENDQIIKDYRVFYGSFLKAIPFSRYNTIYIFMAGMHLHELRGAFDDTKVKWGDYLIWLKNQPVFGRKDYMAKHEFIVYAWKGTHKFYGGTPTTILQYNRPSKSPYHPTTKPVGLVEKLIQDGSTEGALLYDPFLGSGTTLLACERRDRVCYGMELDPHYMDVIIYRWEQMTQGTAKKL